MIEIPLTEADKRMAKLRSIRYANSRKAYGTTDYASRDVRARAFVGFLGQIAFIRHFGLIDADGMQYDAVTHGGIPVEIKVKTAAGLRDTYDIQKIEMTNNATIIYILFFDERTQKLFVVGRASMAKVVPNPSNDNGLLYRKDVTVF